MAEPKTVRVRVAVAVDEEGNTATSTAITAASEKPERFDAEAIEEVAETMIAHYGGGGRVHFIEADIPIPEPQTIEGKVVDG